MDRVETPEVESRCAWRRQAAERGVATIIITTRRTTEVARVQGREGEAGGMVGGDGIYSNGDSQAACFTD